MAAKTSVSGLVYLAQTAVRFVRERSAYPPGQRNVDYGRFDGQRKLDHTTERHQRRLKVPMEMGSLLLAWVAESRPSGMGGVTAEHTSDSCPPASRYRRIAGAPLTVVVAYASVSYC